jgi:NADPH-dependent 2,4-dienoyl-CoA reductase/sulfur reductase-like enzyme
MPERAVIVGASAAGLAAAEALRNKGYAGELTLIGEETHLPYDRPPLSKQVLSGAWEPARVQLRNEQAIAGLHADLRLGARAIGLDLPGQEILLDGGQRVGFDALVIATGARPRRLAGDDLAGVHSVRTLDDALSLRADLLGSPRVVVIGAGFLGAEAAAVAREMSLQVTLVDPLPVPMYRQFGDQVGGVVAAVHRDHGVAVRMGTGVARFLDADGRVVGVELTDGAILDADVVVVAVGAVPATDWLAGSGVPLGNGVECDATCEAAPGVYATGDVASWYNPHFGARMRVEHRLNATEQSMVVADNILGAATPYASIPYFWSDQYDVRIQAYGIFPEGADITLLEGDPADGRFVAAYGRDGTVVGVLGWNSPRQLRGYRKLVADHAAWPAASPVLTV